MRLQIWIVLLSGAVAFAGAGCATIDRLVDYPEPPQVYGGVRNYSEFYQPHGPEVVPFELGGVVPFVVVEYVAMVVLDTVVLPLTIPAELSWRGAEDGEARDGAEPAP